jgi:NAD(P) transhydrogenase
MGKRAAIIERKPKIGGVELQTGSIPSISLREVAYLLSLSSSGGMRRALAPDEVNLNGLLADAVRRKLGRVAVLNAFDREQHVIA